MTQQYQQNQSKDQQNQPKAAGQNQQDQTDRNAPGRDASLNEHSATGKKAEDRTNENSKSWDKTGSDKTGSQNR